MTVVSSPATEAAREGLLRYVNIWPQPLQELLDALALPVMVLHETPAAVASALLTFLR